MRTSFGILLLLLLTTPAQSAELTNLLPGSELHRNARDGSETRSDIWRLGRDGTLSGNYRTSRPANRGQSYVVEGPVNGRWQYRDGALCVEGDGFETSGPICFDIRKGGFSDKEYSATNKTTGFTWQVFIYPRNPN